MSSMPPTLPAMTMVGAGNSWPWISARLCTTASLPAAGAWLTTCTAYLVSLQQAKLRGADGQNAKKEDLALILSRLPPCLLSLLGPG